MILLIRDGAEADKMSKVRAPDLNEDLIRPVSTVKCGSVRNPGESDTRNEDH